MFSVFSLRVPWSTLPQWARWAAKDSSGIIWCFENEPYADPRREKWGVAFGRSARIGFSDTGVNWEASLTKRPDKQEENKVDENKLPVIDISKTFQAYVWDDNIEVKKERDIIVAFSDGSCFDKERFFWTNYELIKEPTFRPFRNRDEFIQWLRDTGRTDMRFINKKGDLNTFFMAYSSGKFNQYINCKWFDNGEPIGIKE